MPKSNFSLHVSVVICCYNSESKIVPTLEHLAKQKTNGLAFEVLLVNNNCTDATVAIAKDCWAKQGCDQTLEIIKESIPGLSFARKSGVMQAKGKYVIFCDDDNWLVEDYIRLAYETMENDPQIGALGGSSDVVADVAIPEWFEEVKSDYAVGKQSTVAFGEVTERGYVWGAGIVLRKEVIAKLYTYGIATVLSDRKGKELSSGGDSEICKWMILLGFKLWYDQRLYFRHYMSSERLVQMYYIEMKTCQNNSVIYLEIYQNFIQIYSLTGLVRFKFLLVASLKIVSFQKNKLNLYDRLVLHLFFGEKLSKLEIGRMMDSNLLILRRLKKTLIDKD